ncbi:hypothetical protein BV898_18271 [Hypsibius exemplaris]|uniref:TMC domain-containing protein n=1 Tax=Hypsibius exemplaris TaxID=2072580 RepID=A0A9X6NGJ2_HYPEX|nr:hypothetical protein BV898_18271 [Hypsibius exemplaris]
MRDSFLHYGFYLSDNKEIFGGWNFDRTLGYLFAVVFFFMFQFIVITYSLANSYGNLVSTTLTGAKSKYCDAVFFLWEHMTRSQEAIAINQVNIKTTLREQLAAVKRQQGFRRILYVRRFIINAGVLGLLVGIAAGIWYLLNNATLAETGGNISESIGLARNLAPVVIITAVNMIMPMAFSWITQLEKYKSYQTQLAMSILKGVLLNLGTIGILYFYWLLEKTGQPLKEAIAVLGNRNCSMPQTVTCWESGLSMRFYQLEIMNLIFELGWTVLIVALVFVQYVSKAKWKPVFPADWLTQRIIYLQIVTWLATYYSPAISGFTLLSTAITVAREVLLIRYTKLYKSAPLGNGSEGTNVIYSAALLASFFAATVCVAFSLTFYMPSHDCGPLRPPFCPQPDVVVAAVRRFSIYSEGLYLIFDTLIMPGMLAFIMLLLLVFIYYYHVKSEAFGELTPVLQNHLALEGKDQIALYLSIVRHQPRRRRRRRRKATTAGNPEDRAQNGAAPHAARSTARRRRAHRDTVVPDAQASSSDALSARTRV